MDDDDFLDRFARGRLETFSHRDHVRLVYARARRTNGREATDFARRGLRELAERHGMPQKYHETLTVAWSRLIAARAEAFEGDDFEAFMEAHPELGRTSLIEEYYSRELVYSAEARAAFVAPDREPLP